MKIKYFFLFFAVFLLIPFIQTNEDHRIDDEDPLTDFTVEVFLRHIGEIDFSESQYDVEMLFHIFGDNVKLTSPDDFRLDFRNAVPATYSQFDEGQDRAAFVVKSTFRTEMDLRYYPFVTLDLPVKFAFGHGNYTVIPIILEHDAFVNGWDIIDQKVETSFIEFETVGRFQETEIHYILQRPVLSAFIKDLMPILMFSVIGASVFLHKKVKDDKEIAGIISLFLGIVIYHSLDVAGTLPPLKYATLQDLLLFGNEIFLLLFLGYRVVQSKLLKDLQP